MRYAAFLQSAEGEKWEGRAEDMLTLSQMTLEAMAEWRQGRNGPMTRATEGRISCDGRITHTLASEHWVDVSVLRQHL